MTLSELGPENRLPISNPSNPTQQSNFQERRRPNYPIGLIVKVRMVSGKELEGQIIKIETTSLGTFLHVEYDEGVINVTSKQICGYYDFSMLTSHKFKAYR